MIIWRAKKKSNKIPTLVFTTKYQQPRHRKVLTHPDKVYQWKPNSQWQLNVKDLLISPRSEEDQDLLSLILVNIVLQIAPTAIRKLYWLERKKYLLFKTTQISM